MWGLELSREAGAYVISSLPDSRCYSKNVDTVSCRVRVHFVMSPEDNRVIAFASVETNEEDKQALVLRRGFDALASMSIGVLRIHQISPENPRIIVLTIHGDRIGHAI